MPTTRNVKVILYGNGSEKPVLFLKSCKFALFQKQNFG